MLDKDTELERITCLIRRKGLRLLNPYLTKMPQRGFASHSQRISKAVRYVLAHQRTYFCLKNERNQLPLPQQIARHSAQLLPLLLHFVFFVKKFILLMLNRTPIFLLFALLLGTATTHAQTAPKYGHMNLGNLLELMPDTKKANDDLKVFADNLSAKDDSLTKAFQAKVVAYQTAYQSGTLTPVQAQAKEAELQKEQEDIQKFEQDAQQTVASKREEFLKPILTKVDDAIKAVAKDNQYLMIFDTSSGAMLFAADTEDVTALVKKKLGL